MNAFSTVFNECTNDCNSIYDSTIKVTSLPIATDFAIFEFSMAAASPNYSILGADVTFYAD